MFGSQSKFQCILSVNSFKKLKDLFTVFTWNDNQRESFLSIIARKKETM